MPVASRRTAAELLGTGASASNGTTQRSTDRESHLERGRHRPRPSGV